MSKGDRIAEYLRERSQELISRCLLLRFRVRRMDGGFDTSGHRTALRNGRAKRFWIQHYPDGSWVEKIQSDDGHISDGVKSQSIYGRREIGGG